MDVMLCDFSGEKTGKHEKIKAHKEGLLHLAYSVFVFNSKKELLIQKRSKEKYHSALKWSNTCCSHPLTDNIKKEAKERLKQEMGIDIEIKEIFRFQYKAKVENLIENEYDYVYIGNFDGNPKPDKSEVIDWKWISVDELKKEIEKNPDIYTPWLRLIIDEVSSFC